MSVRVAGIEYDNVLYDRGADVLYLQVGAGRRVAADFDASPEGHYLRYDEHGALMGITIVNARWILENEGRVAITLPGRQVEAADVAGALAAA